MLNNKLIASAVFLVAALPWNANAAVFNFSFSGPGVSGTVALTYGSATDSKYPQALEVTGISGFFSDSNNGLNIVNASIGPLIPITHDTPEPGNLLAPNDFSRYAVANGLPPDNHGFLTYDNLFWPGGAPPTATNYTVHGGFLDIYGLLFSIGNGQVVDLWSNGDFSGTGNGPIDFGVAVASGNSTFDYVNGGVTVSPEPGAFGLLGAGLLGILAWRRRSTSANKS